LKIFKSHYISQRFRGVLTPNTPSAVTALSVDKKIMIKCGTEKIGFTHADAWAEQRPERNNKKLKVTQRVLILT